VEIIIKIPNNLTAVFFNIIYLLFGSDDLSPSPLVWRASLVLVDSRLVEVPSLVVESLLFVRESEFDPVVVVEDDPDELLEGGDTELFSLPAEFLPPFDSRSDSTLLF
jgi:hypothetical protein